MLLWGAILSTVVLLIIVVSGRLRDTPNNIPISEAEAINWSAGCTTSDSGVLEIASRHPTRAEPLLRWCDLALERKEFDEAVKTAEIITQKFPNCVDAFEKMACALVCSGQRTKAAEVLERSIRRFGKKWPLLKCRVSTVDIAEQPMLVVKLWEELRTLFPGEALSYTYAAEALFVLGRHDEADDLLKDVIDGPPRESNTVDGKHGFSPRPSWRGQGVKDRRKRKSYRSNDDNLALRIPRSGTAC